MSWFDAVMHNPLDVSDMREYRRVIALRILNFFSFLAVIVTMVLSNSGIIPRIGDISRKYPTPLTPADFTFGIWSLIFLLESVFTGYQILPATFDNRKINKRVSFLWMLNCIFTVTWTFAFVYERIFVSTILMWGILTSLILIYARINNWSNTLLNTLTDSSSRFDMFYPTQREVMRMETKSEYWRYLLDFWCVNGGFNIHLAWVSVATIISTFSMVRYSFGIKEFQIPASTGLLALSALLVTTISVFYSDPLFAGVFSWAALGIASEQHQENRLIYALSLLLCLYSASLCALYLGFVAARHVRLFRSLKESSYRDEIPVHDLPVE